MATRVIDDTKLQNIAAAIQGKDSGGVMTVDEMPARIAAIQTGDEVLFSSDGRQYTRTVEIPDGVTTLGEYAFNGCTGLTNITFPDSLTTISDCDFKGCTGLTNITFPDSLTTIGQSAFNGCTGLTNITFPDSLTTISYGAFKGCTGLTEIDLNNVTALLNYSNFERCESLRKIIGKKVVTGISDSCFYCCVSLTTAIFPVATTVGKNTFLAAYALENVDCRNVDRIVQGAFGNCSQLNLIDLTSRATPTTLDNTSAFNNTNNTWIAIVANDTIKSDFQNATNWSTFASHFRTIAEVEAEVGMTYDEYYYQLFGEPRNEVTP